MATKLKEMEKTVNTKLLNESTLFINTSAMSTIRNNIVNDMNRIANKYNEINTITKSAVAKGGFIGKNEATMRGLAKSAAKRTSACSTQATKLKNNITADIKDYKLKLLDDKVAELEASLARLNGN